MSRGGGPLSETLESGEEAWSGRLLRVQRDVVRTPDGARAVREYIRHPGAAAVVALLDDARVLLVRQFRWPLRAETVELPAGKRDPGEPALETARRELLEETGYTARDWMRLGVMHPAAAYTDEAVELWLARGLTAGLSCPDVGEHLECFALAFDEALGRVRDGRITDAKSALALLLAQARISP